MVTHSVPIFATDIASVLRALSPIELAHLIRLMANDEPFDYSPKPGLKLSGKGSDVRVTIASAKSASRGFGGGAK